MVVVSTALNYSVLQALHGAFLVTKIVNMHIKLRPDEVKLAGLPNELPRQIVSARKFLRKFVTSRCPQ